jgi:hypothetical protein
MVTVKLGAEGDRDLQFNRDPAVAVGDAVYLSGTSTVARADASAPGTTPVIGFATEIIGTMAKVRTEKTLGGFAGLTAGLPLFLAASPGAISHTAPSVSGQVIQEVAIAISATTILIRIDTDATVIA